MSDESSWHHSLLTDNATPLATAGEATDAARYPLPTDLPRQFWNADECPSHLLGWLALQFSVDIWNDAWPDDKKRFVIRRSIPLHQKKGTEFAVGQYLLFNDTPAKRFVTPPQGCYAARSRTRQDYEAWIATLPEIRLYKPRPRGRANNFASGPTREQRRLGVACIAGGPGKSYVGIVAGDQQDLLNVTKRKAVLIENGVTTNLRIDGFASQDVETFYIPHRAPQLMRAGGFAGFVAPRPIYPKDYVAKVRRAGEEWWNVTQVGREPINANPQIIAQRGSDNGHAFASRSIGRMYAGRNDNDTRIFESWRIGGVATEDKRKVSTKSIAGRMRVGIQPKTAEITVIAHRRAAIGQFFVGLPRRTMFATRRDNSLVESIKRAIAASKSERDRILIDTYADPPVTIEKATTLDQLQM
jgi:hypothetical protein